MTENRFNDVFARNLKKYMDEYGLTQTDVAKRLGVTISSVSYWLNGTKTPRMDKVDLLCNMFHCDREDLIIDCSKGFHIKNADLFCGAIRIEQDGRIDAESQERILTYAQKLANLGDEERRSVMHMIDLLGR